MMGVEHNASLTVWKPLLTIRGPEEEMIGLCQIMFSHLYLQILKDY